MMEDPIQHVLLFQWRVLESKSKYIFRKITVAMVPNCSQRDVFASISPLRLDYVGFMHAAAGDG